MKKGILFKVSIILLVLIVILSSIYLYIMKNGFFIKNKLVSSIIEAEYSHLKRDEQVKTVHLDNVNIYYNNLDKDELEDIKDIIEKNKTDLEKYLDDIFGENKNDLDIVLIDGVNKFNKEFNNKSKFTEKQGIYANGTIYLPFYLGIDEYIIWHEYTHYRFDKFCVKNEINTFSIPSWFNEGISEYIAYKEFKPFRTGGDYKDIPIKDLDSIISGDDIRVEKAYHKSYKLVEEIIKLKGTSVIESIIIDSKNNDFYKSLEKNLGMKLEKLEKLLD